MKAVQQTKSAKELNERLAVSGFRSTAHREHVYHVLTRRCDHPTAEEVFIEAKHAMPDISMATVYNTLDALVRSHLIRQVNLDRAATRYCANMQDHSHFYCDHCGRVYDIKLDGKTQLPTLPQGFVLATAEISIRGCCPKCGNGNSK